MGLIVKSILCLGYDVIAQAQSGTDETVTFSIAMLQQIDFDEKACQALVLVQTPELAQQVNLTTYDIPPNAL